MEETFRSIGLIFKKYLAQILTILVGLGILMIGISPDEETGLKQNSLFTLGGIGLIIAGIISTLYVAELIGKIPHAILMYAVLPVLLVSYTYMVDRSIEDEIEYRNMIAKTQKEVKQRLKDIRDAQVEFRNTFGYFAPSMDSLKWFVREGKAMDIKRFGDVPTMIDIDMAKALGMKEIPTTMISETQAWILVQKGFIPANDFRRDTTYQPVMEKLFINDKARAKRESAYSFSLDSFDIAPFGLGKLLMFTGKVQKNGLDVPVLLIKESHPITKDTLIVGSLTEVNVNGNWGE